MKALQWEQIDDYHRRAKVVGGWLVKAYEDVYQDLGFGRGQERGYNWNIAMTFVPDQNHQWGCDE